MIKFLSCDSLQNLNSVSNTQADNHWQKFGACSHKYFVMCVLSRHIKTAAAS